MSDDIETLRSAIDSADDDAHDALDRVIRRAAALQKALDDRYAADLKAAKAIFAETGRTSGLPSVKEVVAFYVAEVERLEARCAGYAKQAEEWEKAEEDLSDVAAGNLLALLNERLCVRHLRAKLDRATVAMEPYVKDAENWLYGTPRDLYQDTRRLVAVYAELSADAPAQQTQINDEA